MRGKHSFSYKLVAFGLTVLMLMGMTSVWAGYLNYEGVVQMQNGQTLYFYVGSQQQPVNHWRYDASTGSYTQATRNPVNTFRIRYAEDIFDRDGKRDNRTQQQGVLSFVQRTGDRPGGGVLSENRGFCIARTVPLQFNLPGNYVYREIDFSQIPVFGNDSRRVDNIRYIVNDINSDQRFMGDVAMQIVAQAAIWYWSGDASNAAGYAPRLEETGHGYRTGNAWTGAADLDQPVYGRDDGVTYLDLYRFYTESNPGLSQEDALKLLDTQDLNIAIEEGEGFTYRLTEAEALLAGPYTLAGSFDAGTAEVTVDAQPVTITDWQGQPLSGANMSPGDSFYLLFEDGVNAAAISATFTAQRHFTDIYALAPVHKNTGAVCWDVSQGLMGSYERYSSRTQTATLDMQFYHVDILKYDADGGQGSAALEGAVFQLQRWDGTGYTNYREPGQTGVDGRLRFGPLPGGRYRLVEVQAPDGYQQTEEILFELPGASQGNTLQLEVPNRRIPPVIPPEPETYTLRLVKYDGADDSQRLSGAVFGLYHSIGGETIPVGQAVTNSKGEASFYNLQAGIYQLREITPPQGYEAIGPIDVTIADSGTEDGLIVLGVANEKIPEVPTDPEEPTDPEPPTEPTDPEPTEPTDPQEPTKPEKPEPPTGPKEPTEPEEPEPSTDPTEPTEPEQPTDPQEPQVPSEPKPTEPLVEIPDEEVPLGELPKTGIGPDYTLFYLLAATAILFYVGVKMKQKQN